MPFQIHRTRRTLPKKGLEVAEVKIDGGFIVLQSTREESEIREEITESDKIEEILLERNADHLRQSTIDHTPFAVPPLNDLFGEFGTNNKADEVLNGTLELDGMPLSQEAKSWLQSLQYEGDAPDEIPVNISPD